MRSRSGDRDIPQWCWWSNIRLPGAGHLFGGLPYVAAAPKIFLGE